MNHPPKCKSTNCTNSVKKDSAYPKRWTMFCSRSCANKHTRNISTEKIKATCKEKYGSSSYLTSKEGKEHLIDFYTEKYGVDNPSKVQMVKDIKKKKALEKYGVDNVSKADSVKARIQEVRRPYKQYEYTLPSGKVIKLQGYENRGLDLLLEKYHEDDILFGANVPTFTYEMKGNRIYHPDFYVPKDNLIIEVKSTWTMRAQKDRNLLKEKAVIANGFRFDFMIFDASGALQTE